MSTVENQKNFDFAKLLGILTSIGGIVVFYFWATGRLYASGYFLALNIPSYMLAFQAWEYIEVSWYRLLLFVSAYLLAVVVLSFVLAVLMFWTNICLSKIKFALNELSSKIKIFLSRYHINIPLPKFKLHIPLPNLKAHKSLITAIVVSVFILFWTSLLFVYVFQMGIVYGNKHLLSAPQIEIITSKNLKLDTLGTPYAPESDLYSYNNLRLLNYNQGKYFVFAIIDKKTCKPQNVHVIDEENIESISIGKAPSTEYMPQCKIEVFRLWTLEIPIKIPDDILNP